ncbi:hypothetical protein AVEN_21389-1 [Araneus ventricosus]|uniref:Uncharacterized protein n=1 Tax=Araneus ventricosus TaxID=182803 RepID=A0A4Y2R6C1_ARAVE|nr:hypothetical protein AVEN_21389-1 [Araneus ventricosus]
MGLPTIRQTIHAIKFNSEEVPALHHRAYSTMPTAALQKGSYRTASRQKRKRPTSEPPDYAKPLITPSISTPITMRTAQHPPNFTQQFSN